MYYTSRLTVLSDNFTGAWKVQYREGYCCVHEERVRQKVQPNVALRSGKEFWYEAARRPQICWPVENTPFATFLFPYQTNNFKMGRSERWDSFELTKHVKRTAICLFWELCVIPVVPTGSYVTHETKHFIYFYLGEQFAK